MQYQLYHELPENFFELESHTLHEVFSSPVLFHLEGEEKEPIFLSCLLHGNETTSFYAIQKFLKENGDKPLKRSLLIFIGNIEASKVAKRHLDHQPDYNRIWAGGKSLEHQMAHSVIQYAREHNVMTSIDIHNNTGKNPYYGCVNKLEPDFISLATLFSDKVIYFTEPHEVLSNAFADLCPSLTIECGLPGKPEGIEYVADFIGRMLDESVKESYLLQDYQKYDIFHTVGRIKIPEEVIHDYFFVENPQNGLSFFEEFDNLNFTMIKEDFVFAYYKNEDSRLVVLDNNDKVVTGRYFKFKDGKITIKKEFIPSMFTKEVHIAKEDCLGYVMEHLEL